MKNGISLKIWLLNRWYFGLDAIAVMTPRIRYELLMWAIITTMFLAGIGLAQMRQDMTVSDALAHASNSTAIAILDTKMSETERRQAVTEAKVDLLVSQGIRLEAQSMRISTTLDWFVRIIGMALVAFLGKIFGTIYHRVIEKRKYSGIRDRRQTQGFFADSRED